MCCGGGAILCCIFAVVCARERMSRWYPQSSVNTFHPSSDLLGRVLHYFVAKASAREMPYPHGRLLSLTRIAIRAKA